LRREAEVEQNNPRPGGPKRFHRTGAIAGQADVIIFGEGPPHLGADFFVVIDDQEFGFGVCFHGMRNIVRGDIDPRKR
jgi:hypothetical protein